MAEHSWSAMRKPVLIRPHSAICSRESESHSSNRLRSNLASHGARSCRRSARPASGYPQLGHIAHTDYRRLSEDFGETTRVVNCYGVTEATIDSSFYEGPPLTGEAGVSAPIGRPFANTKLYAGRANAALPDRSRRRIVHWRRWISERLSELPGVDRRAIHHCRSGRRAPSALSNRRPCHSGWRTGT